MWCGVCFQQVQNIKGHECIQKFCKHPHYLFTKRPNKGSQPTFFPVIGFQYVETVSDESGLQTQKFKRIPEPTLSEIKKYYERQDSNSNKTPERVLTERFSQPTRPLQNRRLQALQQKANDSSLNKSLTNITQERCLEKRTANFKKKPPQDRLSSERPPMVSVPSPARGTSQPKNFQTMETASYDEDSELFNEEDDAEDEIDISNHNVIDDDEDELDDPNIMEFLIAAIQHRRAIWDSGSPHADRSQQADRDWNEILQHLFGSDGNFQ